VVIMTQVMFSLGDAVSTHCRKFVKLFIRLCLLFSMWIIFHNKNVLKSKEHKL
jgi:hypothetical protein